MSSDEEWDQDNRDYIQADFPEAQELAAFARGLRLKLGAGWRISLLAPEMGQARIRLTLHHPLLHIVGLGGENLAETKSWVDRFLASEEYGVIGSFPAGKGSAALVGYVRLGIRKWGWSPNQVIQVGETLAEAGLIDWRQLIWVVEAGPLASGWRQEELEEVNRVLDLIRGGKGADHVHGAPPRWM